MTEIGMVRQVGKKHISRGSRRPYPKWQSPTSPKFLGALPTPKRFDLQRPNLVW